MFRIRTGFNEYPDPDFYLNAYWDPDPGSQTYADPDPDKTLPSQKLETGGKVGERRKAKLVTETPALNPDIFSKSTNRYKYKIHQEVAKICL